MEKLGIPFDEAFATYPDDSSIELRFNEMKQFNNRFVNAVPPLFKNFKVYHDCWQFPQILNCFSIKVDLIIDDDEVELVEVRACRKTLSEAKNLAASKIMEIIKTKKPSLFEPPQPIGLPNFRGHCVGVSIFCLLLIYPPFVEAIYNFKEKHSTKLINKLFKLFIDYRKIAAQGELELYNCPTNSHLKYPKRDILNELRNNPRRPGLKPELIMDKDMMAIFAIMVSHGKSDYAKPGCLPEAFFVDLMDTIAIECSELSFSPVDSLFCTKYKAKDGSSHHTYVIRIEPKYNDSIKSIQDLIDKNIFIKDVEMFEQLPKMLTLSVKGPFLFGEKYRFDFFNPSIKDNLEINENLKIGANDYNFLGQVLPISCFQDINTGEKKCRGLPPTITDRFIGLHAILLIKHQGELIEINNHEVLKPLQELKNCQRDSLIFYTKQ